MAALKPFMETTMVTPTNTNSPMTEAEPLVKMATNPDQQLSLLVVSNRLCNAENWNVVLGDPAGRAVRWARRQNRFSEPVWTKWHYTEGNGSFTACGKIVVPFETDGSPQEFEMTQVNCYRCLASMASLEFRSTVKE